MQSVTSEQTFAGIPLHDYGFDSIFRYVACDDFQRGHFGKCCFGAGVRKLDDSALATQRNY